MFKVRYPASFLLMIVLCCFSFTYIPHANAIIIFSNDVFKNDSDTFIIDGDGSSSTSVTLQFGSNTDNYLSWQIPADQFYLSNDLAVAGNIHLEGNSVVLNSTNANTIPAHIVAYQDGTNNGEIRYNTVTNQWEISNNGGKFNPISNTRLLSYVDEEFSRDRANITSDGNQVWGDMQSFGLDEANNCTFSVLDDEVGGIGRIATSNNAINNCLAYHSNATGNAQLIFQIDTLYSIIAKVRPSEANANTNFFVGISDTASAANIPNNGIYFTNSEGNWIGVTRANGISTEIACNKSISTSEFSLVRIKIDASNSISFYIDSDLSDTENMELCGTSSTNIPTEKLSSFLKLGSNATNRFFDIDFYRVWAY
ncbi:MAG: hypothetical protein ACK4NC_04820 [Candidatus Gracilibacteria bacterium]